MKVAVVLNGLPRTYKLTYEAFHEMFDDISYDIFIFAWDHDINELIKCYKPTKIEIDEYSKYKDLMTKNCNLIRSFTNKKFGFCIETGLFAQYYSLFRAYSLIDECDKYDFIIRARFDWKPRFKLDFTVLNINDKTICSPIQRMPGLKKPPYRMNDLFIVSRPKAFATYANLINHITDKEYLKAMKKYNCIIPEFILYYYLIRCNILIDPRYWPYDLFHRGIKPIPFL